MNIKPLHYAKVYDLADKVLFGVQPNGSAIYTDDFIQITYSSESEAIRVYLRNVSRIGLSTSSHDIKVFHAVPVKRLFWLFPMANGCETYRPGGMGVPLGAFGEHRVRGAGL